MPGACVLEGVACGLCGHVDRGRKCSHLIVRVALASGSAGCLAAGHSGRRGQGWPSDSSATGL